jgi:hypothetical protein
MTESRRVVVTGATGLVGTQLCSYLRSQGYQVVVFSRSPQKARRAVPGAAEYVEWDYSSLQGSWVGALSGAYGVVHLAGASLFGSRWNKEYKKKLYDSRIESTRALVQAMERMETRPAVFVSGSAVGYYGHRGDALLDETAEPGDDFLARMCIDWEREALRAEELGMRTVLLRTGIVMDNSGGALAQLKIPFQLFVGGPVLPGTQWISWVHIDDQVGLIRLALENENVRGPLNATAPHPQTNADFSATLGRVLGTPSWLPVPGFALHLLIGEFAEHLTHGQRVLPQRAQDYGYQFRYPTAEKALDSLLGRNR